MNIDLHRVIDITVRTDNIEINNERLIEIETNKELDTIISEVREKSGFTYSDYNNYDAMKLLSETLDSIFIRMNIANESEKLVKNKQKDITKGMSESEVKAYKLGIKNIVSAIDSIVGEEDNFILLTNTDNPAIEFTLGDIMSVIADTED